AQVSEESSESSSVTPPVPVPVVNPKVISPMLLQELRKTLERPKFRLAPLNRRQAETVSALGVAVRLSLVAQRTEGGGACVSTRSQRRSGRLVLRHLDGPNGMTCPVGAAKIDA